MLGGILSTFEYLRFLRLTYVFVNLVNLTSMPFWCMSCFIAETADCLRVSKKAALIPAMINSTRKHVVAKQTYAMQPLVVKQAYAMEPPGVFLLFALFCWLDWFISLYHSGSGIIPPHVTTGNVTISLQVKARCSLVSNPFLLAT